MYRLLQPGEAGPVRTRQVVGLSVAVLLLGAALWTLVRDRDQLASTWESVRNGPWWMVTLWLLLPGANWVFSSRLAWALLRPQPLVDPDEAASQPTLTKSETYEVIGAAWLANLLPLRAGLVSRVFYHKAVNRIPVGTTVRSVLVSVVLGLIASLMLAVLSGGLLWARLAPGATLLVLAAPYPLLLLIGAASPVGDRGSVLTGGFGRWRLWDALAARYADTVCWMARYWVAFALVGTPISIAHAAVFAAVSQIVMLVPIPGNAIGLREWVIALIGPLLPAWLGDEHGQLTQQACLAADLTNRAAEVLMTVLVGSACGGLVTQRLRFRLP
ncbi:MAG: hypothetical protein DYG92_07005 [Leptolyngbya sp. PLA1]|nr:hypothetical protein [Leptolyngbya sp. PLA1]